MNVILALDEARHLAFLVAQDLHRSLEEGLDRAVAQNRGLWEKLQAACCWDRDLDAGSPAGPQPVSVPGQM